ncbi:hypothetical protein NQ318_004691 [Aromia moschata]|uniref:PiggyBac transposable element-derived protein domain-containing protein n=1 Tax=Aromia moschata TaxID=1265417 RepID=A0AAV8X521_9CUCU|nr:hypothetical protein NQ318_004691 [Aromia moschata]
MYLTPNGHSLFTDNWYTSPSLSTYLFQHKTNSCGTVRVNRKHMPDLSGKIQQGQTCCMQKLQSMSSENILVVKWKDRKEVTMLTTMHEDKMIELGKKDRKTKEFIKKNLRP